MAKAERAIPADQHERSNVLAAAAVLLIVAGCFIGISKGLPYIDDGLAWYVKFGPFALASILCFLASGYLRSDQIKDVVKMIPFKIVVRESE